MKTTNTSTPASVTSVLLFLASFGIGYSLVSEFAFEQPRRELLGVMLCLLVAGFASKMRKKAESKQ